METELKIKGLKGGLLVNMPAGSAMAQRDLLIRQIQSRERFFKGGRLALDLGEAEWTERGVEGLLKDMSDEGVCLWAILSTNPQTLQAAAAFGIPASIGQSLGSLPAAQVPVLSAKASTWERLEIEAGQSRQFSTDQVLMGDLPQGATLTAVKSLLIWGHVHGDIFANTQADPEAWLGILHNHARVLHFAGQEQRLPKQACQGRSIELRLVDGEVQLHFEKTRGWL